MGGSGRPGVRVIQFGMFGFVGGLSFSVPPGLPFIDRSEALFDGSVAVVSFIVAGEANQVFHAFIGDAEFDAAIGRSAHSIQLTLVEVENEKRNGEWTIGLT